MLQLEFISSSRDRSLHARERLKTPPNQPGDGHRHIIQSSPAERSDTYLHIRVSCAFFDLWHKTEHQTERRHGRDREEKLQHARIVIRSITNWTKSYKSIESHKSTHQTTSHQYTLTEPCTNHVMLQRQEVVLPPPPLAPLLRKYPSWDENDSSSYSASFSNVSNEMIQRDTNEQKKWV